MKIDYDRRLDFGKHIGERIENVPLDYLRWMLRTMADELTARESTILKGEISRRGGYRQYSHEERREDTHTNNNYATASVKLPPGVTISDLESVVTAGRQTLARKNHPDAGGSTEAMQKVNNAADWLLAAVRSLSPVGGGSR